MLVVNVPVGFPARQFEMPKSLKERSCEGAVHLRPSSTKFLTQEELDEIKSQDAKLFRRLVVVADKKATAKSVAKSEAVAKKKAAEAEKKAAAEAKKAETEAKKAETLKKAQDGEVQKRADEAKKKKKGGSSDS